MAARCRVCSDARERDIDAALLSGQSNRRVATQFQLTESSVRRHASNHVAVRAAEAKAESRRILDVEQQIAAANNATLNTLSNACRDGDGRLVLLASDRVLRQCEFVVGLERDALVEQLAERVQALEQALLTNQQPARRPAWSAA